MLTLLFAGPTSPGGDNLAYNIGIVTDTGVNIGTDTGAAIVTDAPPGMQWTLVNKPGGSGVVDGEIAFDDSLDDIAMYAAPVDSTGTDDTSRLTALNMGDLYLFRNQNGLTWPTIPATFSDDPSFNGTNYWYLNGTSGGGGDLGLPTDVFSYGDTITLVQ